MAAPPSDTAPLEAVEETIGPAAAEAFKILGNETRMAILVALWDAHDPLAEDNSLSFTELRNRVGIRQGGRFNYHLDKVVGRYVARTDDGYVLRPKGLKLLETIVAGTGHATSLAPTEIDVACQLCGGDTAITYRDEGELYHVCLDCEGNFDWGTNVCSAGHVYRDREVTGSPLSAVEFEPAGLADRSPEVLFAAGRYALYGHQLMKSGGVCDECHGVTDASLAICTDHDASSGRCPSCEKRSRIRVRFVCSTCKEGGSNTPAGVALFHPAVIAFLYDQGVHIGAGMNDFETLKRNRRLLDEEITVTEDVRSIDPPRVEVTYETTATGVSLVFDEGLDVVEVSDIEHEPELTAR